MSGVTTQGGTGCECLLAPDGRRLAHRDVGDPLCPQHRDEQQPDRTGAGDQHPIIGLDIGQPQRVQGDGHRLGQRSHSGRKGVRDPDEAVSPDGLVLAERAAVADEVGRGAVQAHRRAAPPAGTADAAARSRVSHDAVAGRPAGVARCRGHHARPFVPEDRPRLRVLLQDHVEVGTADPALGDLHEHFAGPRLRPGDLVDLDPAVAHVDGRWHQVGRHGANTKWVFPIMPGAEPCNRVLCATGLVRQLWLQSQPRPISYLSPGRPSRWQCRSVPRVPGHRSPG